MRFTIFASVVVLAIAQANAATVTFYGEKGCKSSRHVQKVGCNVCIDPPGDFQSISFSGLSKNQRVSVHNQNKCTPKSSVGQWYGSLCANAGRTALRSAWVACNGQREIGEMNSTTTVTDELEEPLPTITFDK